MIVYVAGSSDQLDRVRAAMDALEARGHTVSHDWPDLVEAAGGANPPDATRAQSRKWGADDLMGVYHADVLWLLMPAEGGFGAAVEMGFAIAHGIPIVASGCTDRSIFTAFATCYDRDDQALEAEFPLDATAECDCRDCVSTRTTGAN